MNNLYERYERQIILPELGETGQQKLLSARVLVIGAGGLGCPALLYLAAAGVGTIGIVDNDIVSLNNLHRQVLFSMEDTGLQKIAVAKRKLRELNPDIKVDSYGLRLSNKNALELFEQYDIILDCTDNFPTRYMINDACLLSKKPLIFGAISKFEGQVAIFNAGWGEGIDSVNYRDLFPDLPGRNEIKNCEEGGVIGVLPGVVGALMANEAIKLIAGFGEPLINRMLIIDLLTYQQRIIKIRPAHFSSCIAPKTKADFAAFNYDPACFAPDAFTIDIDNFEKIKDDKNTLLVDVREIGETPIITRFINVQVPLSVIKNNDYQFIQENIVLFCKTGKRSIEAAGLISRKFGTTRRVYSLTNGIANLL